jgi:hypothetical protein
MAIAAIQARSTPRSADNEGGKTAPLIPRELRRVGDGLLHGLKLVAAAIVWLIPCVQTGRATLAVLSLIPTALAPAARSRYSSSLRPPPRQ